MVYPLIHPFFGSVCSPQEILFLKSTINTGCISFVLKGSMNQVIADPQQLILSTVVGTYIITAIHPLLPTTCKSLLFTSMMNNLYDVIIPNWQHNYPQVSAKKKEVK